MFYCAQALLLQKSLSFSKHAAVISAFGEHFAKTGVLDPKYHRYLREAFDERILGDYDVLSTITKETASVTIERAQEFLNVIRKHLGFES